MTLYDLLKSSSIVQQFSIYLTNNYDQNIFMGRGNLENLFDLKNNEYEVFDHLMDEIDYYRITKDYRLVIFIKDDTFDIPLEKQYDEKYVKTWDRKIIKTRPWRYSIEIDNFEKII